MAKAVFSSSDYFEKSKYNRTQNPIAFSRSIYSMLCHASLWLFKIDKLAKEEILQTKQKEKE